MSMHTVFVTGATGLLGNNLVRALLAEGIRVKALARSKRKAEAQFGHMEGLEIVEGDLARPQDFAAALTGVDAVFHTAAYFRESYQGGDHAQELIRINVDGTRALLDVTYRAGIRHFCQTSSIAVLDAAPGALINETCDRAKADADPYYLSKIMTEETCRAFCSDHPDMKIVFVLPGWMWGPGDLGPTSAGKLALDVAHKRLPGMTPGSFSLVDARDVAAAEISAMRLLISGEIANGERFIAAGRHTTMTDLVPVIGRIAGVKVPSITLPFPLIFAFAGLQEVWGKLTGQPVVVSLAMARLLKRENGRSHYDHRKSESRLGLTFRPLQETVSDTISYYRAAGMIA